MGLLIFIIIIFAALLIRFKPWLDFQEDQIILWYDKEIYYDIVYDISEYERDYIILYKK